MRCGWSSQPREVIQTPSQKVDIAGSSTTCTLLPCRASQIHREKIANKRPRLGNDLRGKTDRGLKIKSLPRNPSDNEKTFNISRNENLTSLNYRYLT